MLATPTPSRHLSQCREISGLSYTALSTCPWPKSRLKGIRGKGLAYERLVSRVLPGASAGLWYEFYDSNGYGRCGIDLLIHFPDRIAVLECKLTDTDEGRRQILLLYRPVLEHFYRKLVCGIVVCKNLTPASQNIHHSLSSALRAAEGPRIPTLHWRGKGPIA